jgi:hypothetical protein
MDVELWVKSELLGSLDDFGLSEEEVQAEEYWVYDALGEEFEPVSDANGLVEWFVRHLETRVGVTAGRGTPLRVRDQKTGEEHTLSKDEARVHRAAVYEYGSKSELEEMRNYSLDHKKIEDLNAFLRGGFKEGDINKRKPKNWSKGYGEDSTRLISKLDRALERTTVKEDIVVFRGVRGLKGQIFEVDEPLNTGAYTSCSSSRRVAEHFAKGSDPILMRIFLPKGAHAMSIMDISAKPLEKEILIARGVELKIIVDESGGVKEIEVEYVL